MAYEQRDNSGSLFRNEKREKDTHPHATGSALIDGVEYWVSAWTKQDRNGNRFQSLAFKRKESKPGTISRADTRTSYDRDDPRTGSRDLENDEVPF